MTCKGLIKGKITGELIYSRTIKRTGSGEENLRNITIGLAPIFHVTLRNRCTAK